MISMSKIYSIHQLRRNGDSISEIARKTGVSRNTVCKYLGNEDYSPRLPEKRRRPSKLDRYKPLIDSWLDDERLELAQPAPYGEAYMGASP